MSVSAGQEMHVTEHRAAVNNTSDSGIVNSRQTAPEDREILGYSVGDHENPGNTSSWEIWATLGEPSGLSVQAGFPSTGESDINDNSTFLFNAGLTRQNDSTNGLGFTTEMTTAPVFFPVPFAWDEDETLTVSFWNSSNSQQADNMRALIYYVPR